MITKDFTDGPWTQFVDMHSGGGLKEGNYEYIYIQAPQDEAERVFYARLGHAADRVTCTCCGSDYSVTESPDLYQATAYERGCHYDEKEKRWIETLTRSFRAKYATYQTLDEFMATAKAKFIAAKDIKPKERTETVPRQGYVWVD